MLSAPPMISSSSFLVCIVLAALNASVSSVSLYASARMLESVNAAPCSAEEAAYKACVTPANTVSLQTLDCTFCSVGAMYKLHSFTSTEEQVTIVCNALQEAHYCETEFNKCVRDNCPLDCQEKVSAHADCIMKESGCDMDCSSSAGWKMTTAAGTFAFGAAVILGVCLGA